MPLPKQLEDGKNSERMEAKTTELAVYSPVELIEIVKKSYHAIPKEICVYKALFAPKINAFQTQIGEDELFGFIVNHLDSLMNWFLVRSKPNREQLFEIAEFIIREYPEFTIEDIRLFAQSMRLLEIKGIQNTYPYPKIYERMDGAILQECLRVYEQAKSEATRKRRDELEADRIAQEREINRQNWLKHKENENCDEFLWK